MARSDVQLMLDVKAGDEQSFALLLHRYRSPLVNFLYRMVRNREQAEDLAQEVFIRVYRAREEYVPSAKFTTWLLKITRNLVFNELRRSKRRAHIPIQMDPDAEEIPLKDEGTQAPDAAALEKELQEAIDRAIAHPVRNRILDELTASKETIRP